MDDGVRFDHAQSLSNKTTGAHGFDFHSIDLNSYLYREKRTLARMAAVLGNSSGAAYWTAQADTLLPEPPVHGERSRVASRSFGSDSPGPGGTPYVRPHGVSRGFPNPSPLTGRVTGSGVGAAPAGAGLTDGWRAR